MKILAGVDFSSAAASVLDVASRLATASGASVTLLHAAAPEPSLVGYDDDGGPRSAASRVDELIEERKELAEQTQRLRESGVSVDEPILRVGPTTETILAVADEVEADLIVLARHRHGRLHQLLLGNTAEAVVRDSPRPVVVVPA